MTTKEKVLEILKKNEGKSISGQKLAEKCRISRAAIWKAVKSLRDQGCNIQGATNGGYLLLQNSDYFSNESLEFFLNEKYPEVKSNFIQCFNVIDSTNTYCKKVLSEAGNMRLPDGELTAQGQKYHKAIIVAQEQTGGRGRFGRNFASPAKTGIYMTLIYTPKGGIVNPAKITAFSAVAVCRAIKTLFNVECKIKWINDIYLNGKKICGILTEGFTNFETKSIESAIIGIGLNICDNPKIFEENTNAGSITGENHQGKISRCQVAAEIAGQCFKIFEENQEEVLKEYKNLSFLISQTVCVFPVIGDSKSSYFAKVINIDDNAGLVVELPDGSQKTLSSGEVSLHIQ